MSEVTKPILKDDTFRELMGKQNSLLATMVRQNAPSEVDWLMMEEYAHEGVFSDLYSFGDKFLDTWKDITDSDKAYTYPWRFNHVGDVTLADGEVLKNRPCLQLHYAHKYGVQFSHPRALCAVAYKVTTALISGGSYYFVNGSKAIQFNAPSGGVAVNCWLGYRNGRIDVYNEKGNYVTDVAISTPDITSAKGTSLGNVPTMSAGNYYFIIGYAWTANTPINEVVSFTLSTPLTFGQKICGCYQIADNAKSKWRMYTYDVDGKTKIEDALVVGGSSDGINLGTIKYDTRTNGDYLINSMQELGYGWNRWKTSAARQYLNSSANVGLWWKPQDMFDIAPDQLPTIAGFLSGCSEAMIDAIKPVAVKTYVNTTQDGTSEDYDITYDKVFLPSLEEMYINPQHAGEGENHEYWVRRSGRETPFAQGDNYPELIHYAVENHTSAQYVRLRSASRSYSHDTWYVYSSGYVNNYGYASSASRFSPIVVL